MAFRDPVTSIPAAGIVGLIRGTQLAADSIDGKTITGALIRTAATGARWEIGSDGYSALTGYSGVPDETGPATLQSGVYFDLLVTLLQSPASSAGLHAALTLLANRPGSPGAGTVARLEATKIELNGPSTVSGSLSVSGRITSPGPSGFLGYGEAPAADRTTTSGAGNTIVPVVAGRYYRVTASYRATQITAVGTLTVTINAVSQSAKSVWLIEAQSQAVGAIAHGNGSLVYQAGITQTEQFYLTVSMSAGAQRIAAGFVWLSVEDIGS